MTLPLFPQEFNPSRLTLARRLRGLKRKDLATRAGLTPVSVSNWENGVQDPCPRSIAQFAQALAVPDAFFRGETLEEPDKNAVSFRAMSKMSASERDAALAAGALAMRVNTWLEERFELPRPNLPNLGYETDPESAADVLRRMWGLGELSITNLIHTLESRGVRIFSLSVRSKYLDAFSLWHGGVPYVFLNNLKSAERSRFDCAHELAHLVLHSAGARSRDAENEANDFASAFLMPRGSVLGSNGLRSASLEGLIRWKGNWSVSVAALARRLYSLKLLSEWRYRQMCIQMQSRGYFEKEPDGMEREVSQVWAKVFASLRQDGMKRRDFTDALAMNPEDLNDLVFGLAFPFKAITGGHKKLSGPPIQPPELFVHLGSRA